MKWPLRSGAVAVLILLLASCGGGSGGSGTTGPPPGGGNHNPTVNLNIDNLHLAYGGTAQLMVTATDPDGDQLSFTWSATLGTVTSSGPTATSASFTAGNHWGQASVTVIASDGHGGSAQATALTYIRNPNPPSFSFSGVGSSTCGYGTQNPDGLVLRITPAENLAVTRVSMKPRDCSSSCSTTRDYSTPLNLVAGQGFVWSDGGCHTPQCCLAYCGSCGFWTITIAGRRPEPDGGTFYFECYSWYPPSPNNCN